MADRRNDRIKGFGLIELMIVLVVASLLMSIAVPAYDRYSQRARVAGASDNICRTIIKMASELGKRSIAEGVETKEQLDFLIRNGCNFVQGFYYSAPLHGDSFLEFIRKQDFHTQRRKALEIVKA